MANSEQSIRFPSHDADLEGQLWLLGAPHPSGWGVVLCHPHPLHGGDMDNPLVVGVARALQARGLPTLRFNFRGTGASTGTHTAGEAEPEDVRGAIQQLVEKGGVRHVCLVGYSFGSWMSAKAAESDDRVGAVVLLAPPLTHYAMEEAQRLPMHKLLLVGDADAYCPLSAFERWAKGVRDPKRTVVLPQVDHFFGGNVRVAAAHVERFVLEVIDETAQKEQNTLN